MPKNAKTPSRGGGSRAPGLEKGKSENTRRLSLGELINQINKEDLPYTVRIIHKTPFKGAAVSVDSYDLIRDKNSGEQARIDIFMPDLSFEERLNLSRSGIESNSFFDLTSILKVTSKNLSSYLNIPLKTLDRRKKEGFFKADETEKILRVIDLLKKAEEVFGGMEPAIHWLKEEQYFLGGRTPLSVCDSLAGSEEVFRILGRMEHGVYS